MTADSISTKKLKATLIDLQASLINVVSLEAETLNLIGDDISIGKKLGVTGSGNIESRNSVKLGSVYSTNLKIRNYS